MDIQVALVRGLNKKTNSTILCLGTGYSSVRTQSSVSNQRFSAISGTENTDNYQVSLKIIQIYPWKNDVVIQEENQNAPQSTVPNVDEIRKRLARIKAQAF